ncbi:hypothetical protein HK104_003885, partial [Borealophlyctis nickersoniae]
MSTQGPTIPGFEGPLRADLIADTDLTDLCPSSRCDFSVADDLLRFKLANEICLPAATCVSFVCRAKASPATATSVPDCFFARTPLMLIALGSATVKYTYIK